MSSSKDRSTPLTNSTHVQLRHFRLSKLTVGVRMFDHLLDEVRPEEAAKCTRVGTEWLRNWDIPTLSSEFLCVPDIADCN